MLDIEIIGTIKLSIPWAINAFGGGYGVQMEEAVRLRFIMHGGSDLGAGISWSLL